MIIDEQNEDRFSHSYITRTSICIHFICVQYCSCGSIKNVKTVTSLNKHEVLIYGLGRVRLTLFRNTNTWSDDENGMFGAFRIEAARIIKIFLK